jgi:hypothetical protein
VQLLRRFARLVLRVPAFGIVKLPFLRGYRQKLLASGTSGAKRGPLNELLYYPVHYLWLRHEYWSEPDPDRRTEKAMLRIGGAAGVASAKSFQDRGLDFSHGNEVMTLWDAVPTYATLERVLRAAPPDTTVIQVGSSSGREIAWVAREFPELRCIGADLIPEVVEYASAVHQLPNLEFATVSAKKLGDYAECLGDRPIVVFSVASLQQAQPEHIDMFFEGLSRLPRVEVVLTETASLTTGDPREIDGSRPRPEWFDYSHNYKLYAERHGFSTTECRVIEPQPDDPVQGQTVNYFYWGWAGQPVAPQPPQDASVSS